jgi:predicted RNA methylase
MRILSRGTAEAQLVDIRPEGVTVVAIEKAPTPASLLLALFEDSTAYEIRQAVVDAVVAGTCSVAAARALLHAAAAAPAELDPETTAADWRRWG